MFSSSSAAAPSIIAGGKRRKRTYEVYAVVTTEELAVFPAPVEGEEGIGILPYAKPKISCSQCFEELIVFKGQKF